MYTLASPISHVRPGCPPTLLIQGKKDFVTPVGATNELYQKLVDAGVPAINVVYPWTDHGFDIKEMAEAVAEYSRTEPPTGRGMH